MYFNSRRAPSSGDVWCRLGKSPCDADTPFDFAQGRLCPRAKPTRPLNVRKIPTGTGTWKPSFRKPREVGRPGVSFDPEDDRLHATSAPALCLPASSSLPVICAARRRYPPPLLPAGRLRSAALPFSPSMRMPVYVK